MLGSFLIKRRIDNIKEGRYNHVLKMPGCTDIRNFIRSSYVESTCKQQNNVMEID